MNHVESEMEELISRISLQKDEVRVVMEATGAYHFPVLHRLKEAGLFVSVINPLVMKKYAGTALRSQQNSGNYFNTNAGIGKRIA